jgi:hypothetical protein
MLRPAYTDSAVECLRLCNVCEAQPIPMDESARLERQLAAQRAVVTEMCQRREGAAQ